MSMLADLGIQLTNDKFTDDELQQLTELLLRNADIFVTDLSQIRRCTLSKHTIQYRRRPTSTTA